MEINVSKSELLRELTATQGVVERKTTIPILSNFLFEAGGDKLSITRAVAHEFQCRPWVRNRAERAYRSGYGRFRVSFRPIADEL